VTLVVVLSLAWVALAVFVGLVLGRAARMAEAAEQEAFHIPDTVAELGFDLRAHELPPVPEPRRPAQQPGSASSTGAIQDGPATDDR